LSDEKEVEGVTYQPCIVTFIDILGFRTLIENRPPKEVYKVLQSLKHFTNPVEDLFGGANISISRAHARSVSDAVVRVRPYKTAYRDGALVHEILDLLHAQIELISQGVLVRAGLTVGDAFLEPSPHGTIFGPAMVRAYEIESQEAIYPRIVIDDLALEQHASDEGLRSDHNTLEYEQRMLAGILAAGDDGTKYIDYLRADAEFDDPGLYFQFLQDHAKLIREGRKASQDRRIRRKYEWLAAYHNKRIQAIRQNFLSSKERADWFTHEYEIDPSDYLQEVTV